ncbi:MAG: glucose-1-phosphate adenylyltransferase [Firmicutes bacterium GWF2_51_9]|nr:MAG: glucose-1-phosphate adenylyltransferase [Firmicutes bacterium GWF2_51_9]OGS58762.1 MAG: glucose-1-phosphate adenylyltransferase [Firmicutes bacterium GWE2_51_13]HAO60526.1 glucose-1-phosphate adenylyltransferase [Erysipelotrichaceae bacterium]HBZ41657.1 glucose-1-phosphate adenylyltransferase [Erysipelotrichaceae bacterium]
MRQHSMVAMILAGGRGSRLLELTNKVAKPAVYFGGKYRIIDFPLSNCANSDINIVGVLTQYESVLLNSYVTQDQRWGLDAKDSGIFVLPPREKSEGFGLYRGTADAITQNIDFLDQYDPEYVLILSGDHIYKMDYDKMLSDHKKNNADITIAVLEVPLKEASRFGIMNADETGRIVEFEEKPKQPKSNLASMGVYIFNWKLLRKMLVDDVKAEKSSHDFGKDIIPGALNSGKRLFTHRFKGYWKDVGTIDSLWEANMDLIYRGSELDLSDPAWKIYTEDITLPSQYIGRNATVKNAYINQGCIVDGHVENSVLFTSCVVEEGAKVIDSVLMPGAIVRKGALVQRVIVADEVEIKENAKVGKPGDGEIELIHRNVHA